MFIFVGTSLAIGCDVKNDRCIKGKVVRISCASFVVQVLNRDSIGTYGWRDVGGHTVYNNVFRVGNPCKIGQLFNGDEIYFTIADSLTEKNCVTCMMYDAPPDKVLQLENVSRKACP